MKGKALFQLGQRTRAAAEFRTLLEKYPTSELAANAKQQLRALGL
ncbi:MAG TPA: transporter, partial [Solibacterales bacterium]|nr:transporter [Bryobacterales bacterium]